MDDSDPEIVLLGNNGCNHCIAMKSTLGRDWFMDSSGEELLSLKLDEIKRSGVGKEFDSILGLSGGVDSSYLAIKAFDWGLRPLVVHVDAGWNSELSVSNIQSILDYTGWDLHTKVINWSEMADLQRAYLKSGISNQDVPQDHAFFAALYNFAVDEGVRFVLNGGNIATEGIFPRSWLTSSMDSINLKAIHGVYGEVELESYPTISFFDYYFNYPYLKKMRPVRLLNYIKYDKEVAILELEKRVGFKRYPRKHGESMFTRFFQEYYLIKRYGIDKRKAHFSSLIVSNQMSRQEAIQLLEEPLYTFGQLERDIDYFCRKLRISRDDFEQYLNAELRNGSDFPNWNHRYTQMKKIQNTIQRLLGVNMAKFS
jgi:N-acetyl sugar amidotransferase